MDLNFDSEMMIGMALIFLVCLFLYPKWTLKKKEKKERFFFHTLIYADQKKSEQHPDFGRLLYSAQYDLQGKPDYIYQKWISRALVPVELKSGKIGESPTPHHGDYLQLCTYFLIIEDVYGVRPKYGRLVYHDYMFYIRNTKRVRKEVLRIVSEMEDLLEYGTGSEPANGPKCRTCICNGTVCEHCQNETGKWKNEHNWKK